MQLRHKVVKIFDDYVYLGTLLKGDAMHFHREEILNAGKINHKIHGSFQVIQNTGSRHSIKFFILTDIQFAEWFRHMAVTRPSAFSSLAKSNISDPQYYLYSSTNAVTEGKFEIQMGKENVLYFVLDNSFSSISSKTILLTVWEEWNESILPIDVVTTTPPQDTSIDETIHGMILSATKELKILSPYIDMYLVKKLLEQYDKGIKIFIITRDITEKSHTRENKQALTFIQKKLGDAHKMNPYIHSRMIIRDEIDALVSSADLTESSLKSHYNAGIILSDPTLVQKLLNYFNQAFRDSKPMRVSN
ncbi:MAG: phospholipase D-like domain-containing protein [Nitrososphaeraceae archaeon]